MTRLHRHHTTRDAQACLTCGVAVVRNSHRRVSMITSSLIKCKKKLRILDDSPLCVYSNTRTTPFTYNTTHASHSQQTNTDEHTHHQHHPHHQHPSHSTGLTHCKGFLFFFPNFAHTKLFVGVSSACLPHRRNTEALVSLCTETLQHKNTAHTHTHARVRCRRKCGWRKPVKCLSSAFPGKQDKREKEEKKRRKAGVPFQWRENFQTISGGTQ